MKHLVSRGRLWVPTLLSALAISIVVISPGAAQAASSQPGEYINYANEMVGGQPLRANGPVSQAGDTAGNFVTVWRGYDNDGIWLSFNNGSPIAISNSATTQAGPRVVWDGVRFVLYHTGTNGQIYEATGWGDNRAWWGSWSAVPNARTNPNLSPAAASDGKQGVMLMWKGQGQDDQIVYSWRDGSQRYGTPLTTGNNIQRQTKSSPAVAYDKVSNRFFVAFRNVQNRPAYTWTAAGQNIWDTPQVPNRAVQDVFTDMGPAVVVHGGVLVLAATERGQGTSAFVRVSTASKDVIGGWTQEASKMPTNSPSWLVGANNGAAVVSIATAWDGWVYWKAIIAPIAW
ncbi:hypothetical protein ACSHXN_44875 (plasmid) [Streptomyces sp. HUAS TT11]|uniref:hypothetical protein n=1 Tax=Streptomyces sp. HUAS TT11 TaxID=3447508 RepID=UPI003F65E610